MTQNFVFAEPFWIFFAIFLSVVLVVLFFWKTKKYNFIWLGDITSVYKKNTYWKVFFCTLCILVTIVFGCVLAKPTYLFQKETIKKDGIDIQIVFDTSYSMIAEDIAPSRIEVAKEVISTFIGQLEGDRVGIVLFAGKPFTSVPLTFDYDFLQDFLWEVSVNTIDQDRPYLRGTAIWDSLVLAADNLLKDEPEREKVIVLMTDGEANVGIDPLLALRYVKEKSIKTYSIWVGSEDETFIELIDDFWFKRRVPIGGVDEETLKKIANETGGNYYRADSKQALDSVFSDIQSLEKKEIEVEYFTTHTREYSVFLLMLTLLVFGVCFIVFGKKIEL